MTPTISIITVCFQAEKTIRQTIESVLSQTYPAIEYIIIDGASIDGTLQIIHQYRDRIAKVVSEKDEGLYDAMNKGLRLATGDYVYFLNADDLLYDKETLAKAFGSCRPTVDILYGEAMFIDDNGKQLGLRSENTPHKVPEVLDWKSLRYGMVISHQSFIVRRSLAGEYNLQYRLCADIDWMIRCIRQSTTSCNTHLIISKFRTGGTSKQHQKNSWKERYAVLSKHYGAVPNFFHHVFIAVRYVFNKKY